MTSTLPSRRRGLFAWILLAAALLWGAMAAPMFVGHVYTGDDLGAFHLPARAFYAQRLAAGEPFDWMPSLFCGFYLSGEGQAGTYHPLHFLLYRFLPLGVALNLELLVSYPLLLAGTYLFLRRLVGRSDAAMFGSLAFTFGSFNLLHFIHPNGVAVVAHLPWLLWAIDRLLAGPPRGRAAALTAAVAVLTGSQLLLGYPQYVWLSLLAEASYALLVFAGRVPRAGRPLAQLAIAKAVGVLIGGIQLLPTAEALLCSARRAVDADFTNWGSLDPLNLVQLVAPYLFTDRVVGQNAHELGLYLGAVPLVLIVWLFAKWKDLGVLRRPAGAAIGLGLLALLLAMGEHGHLYRLQRLLPLVGSFRFPCRYTVLFQLCAAVLAAISFSLLARRRTAPRRSAALGMTFGASLLAAVVGQALSDRPFIASAFHIRAGPLLIGSAALLLALAARGVRGAAVGLVALAAADLGCYGLSYSIYPQTHRLEVSLAQTSVPPHASGGRVLADTIRCDEPGLHTGNQMSMLGWRRADGYAGLEPARQLDYRQLSALRVAGVDWVRRTEATETIEGLIPYDDHWLRVPEPLPRAWLATSARATDDPGRELRGIPLETTALTEYPVALSGGPPGTVAVLSDRPGQLRLQVDCPAQQLLVVSESYHTGWQARVDGQPCPVLRVNGDFLGCVVFQGRCEVAIEFHPRSLCYGRILSLIGLGLAAACCLAPLVRLRPTLIRGLIVLSRTSFQLVRSMGELKTRPTNEVAIADLHALSHTANFGESMSPQTASSQQRPTGALLSVVLPVYNEAKVLPTLLRCLTETLDGEGTDYEVLFVDDGSSDESPELLDRLAADNRRVRVVHLARNFGHQAAIHAGLAHTRGDAIVLMDSDMQDAPEAIPRFLAQWRAGYDVVYAVRTQRKENPVKRCLFAAFHRLLSRMAYVRVPADAGIFGLIDRRVARTVLAMAERDRYFPGLRSWVGFRQTGVPVERNARYDERPRVSLAGLFRLAKTAVFSFSTLPLSVFYAMGLLAGATFLLVGGFSLYCKLFTDLAIPGWTSHILVGSFFGALNALGICILGEYVIRIYDQVRARPLYLVDRTVNMEPSHESAVSGARTDGARSVELPQADVRAIDISALDDNAATAGFTAQASTPIGNLRLLTPEP